MVITPANTAAAALLEVTKTVGASLICSSVGALEGKTSLEGSAGDLAAAAAAADAAADGSDDVPAPGTPTGPPGVPSSVPSNSLLEIVTNQRDRFRRRCVLFVFRGLWGLMGGWKEDRGGGGGV